MTLLLGAIITLFAWPTPEQVDEAVQQVYEDDSLQRDLPRRKMGSAELSELPPPPPRQRRRRGEATTGAAGGLMWVVIALCVAAVLVVVARELFDRPEVARIVSGEQAARAPPEVRVSAQTLGDAESLARAGRYAEAIRTLLHQTFGTIGQQHAFAASTTSREILASVPMQGDAHAALGQLVTAVEITLFGGAAADEGDYTRCLEAYRRVLSARGVRVV